MTTIRPSRLQPLPSGHRIVYNSRQLIPDSWWDAEAAPEFHIYNPTLTRTASGLVMAYRVDSGRGLAAKRRIAACRLDADLQIVPGSVVPVSDSILDGGPRHYDPRFVNVGKRLYIHYNNAATTWPNHLYLVELDPDTLAAREPARELILTPRQQIEKNWMFFTHEETLFAVYWIAPHTILRIDLRGKGPIQCAIESRTDWNVDTFAQRYGQPCGGASPILLGDLRLAVFHSRRQTSPLHSLAAYWPHQLVKRLHRFPRRVMRKIYTYLDKRRYYAGLYAFDANPPFHPRWICPEAILLPENEPPPTQRPINALGDGIIFPCGMLPWGDNTILVAFGIHDERCALQVIDLEQLPKQQATFTAL